MLLTAGSLHRRCLPIPSLAVLAALAVAAPGDRAWAQGRYNVNGVTALAGNNPVFGVPNIVWQQAFDAQCNVVNVATSFDLLPLSAPANRPLRLRLFIARCPGGGLAPVIAGDWGIICDGQPPRSGWLGTASGVPVPGGWIRDIVVITPANVGIATLTLGIWIRDPLTGRFQTQQIQRKIYITVRPNRGVGAPTIAAYERACGWAACARTEIDALRNLRAGIFTHLPLVWRYGYDFAPGVAKCNWVQLITGNACNYSDCYVFSDVLGNLGAVLGIGGFLPVNPVGSAGMGFVTDGAPSLDPAFTGSAFNLNTLVFDGYLFSSHSLLRRGTAFHDATFNGEYADPTAFITWNVTKAAANLLATDNPAVGLRYVPGHYDSWSDVVYPVAPPAAPGPPDPPLPLAAGLHPPEGWTPAPLGTNASVSSTSVTLVDDDGDGYYDALAADLDLNVTNPGDYVYGGYLSTGDSTVVRRRHRSPFLAGGTGTLAAGPATVRVEFSGGQIFEDAQDGPYDLHLFVATDSTLEDSLTVTTSAYSHQDFGEADVLFGSVIDAGVDTDLDSRYDVLRVSVDVDARVGASYLLMASALDTAGVLASTDTVVTLSPGLTPVTLDLPGPDLFQGGMDGPYDLVLTLADAAGEGITGMEAVSQAYQAGDFDPPVLYPDGAPTGEKLDPDAYGKYTTFRLHVPVMVTEPGTYHVSAGILTDTGTDGPGESAEFALSAGASVLDFDFMGMSIYAHQGDGPFTLSSLTVADPATGDIQAHFAPGLAVGGTETCLYTDFEALHFLSFDALGADYGVDTDADTYYDSLVVEVEIDCTGLGTDTFIEVEADLTDGFGNFIAHGHGELTAACETDLSVPVQFLGLAVFGSRVNGPYEVRNVALMVDGNIDPFSYYTEYAGATSAYAFTEFEHTGLVVGRVDGYGGGSPIAGAVVGSPEEAGCVCFDFTEGDGTYALSYPTSAPRTISVEDPGDPGSTYLIFVDSVFVGSGDSTVVSVAPGDTVEVDFRRVDPGGVPEPEPQHFVLRQNTPNPFAARTTISFHLAREADVRLRIFDIAGREVAGLVDDRLAAGEHAVPADLRHLSAGIYVYRLEVDGVSRQRKMILKP